MSPACCPDYITDKFGCNGSPIGSCFERFIPQLVVLFWEVIETLGGGSYGWKKWVTGEHAMEK
jgi:hypothetical protein